MHDLEYSIPQLDSTARGSSVRLSLSEDLCGDSSPKISQTVVELWRNVAIGSCNPWTV